MKIKKIVGTSALVAILALTGCGKENKLVCKNSSNNLRDIEMVLKYDKNGSLKSVQSISTYKTDESAEMGYALEQIIYPDESKKDGKKVIVNLTKEQFIASAFEEGQDTSKESMKKELKNLGYTCK